MKCICVIIITALFTLLAAPDTGAQGTTFTYQGRINVNGVPANGLYDFRFRLSADSSGNVYVGSPQTLNARPVSNGLFTVLLDFGANFPGADRWLEIGVRTNGALSYSNLLPLQALTPTPYAITASKVADSALSGNVALLARSPQTFSGLNIFNSDVGIGTMPSTPLHVANGGDATPTGGGFAVIGTVSGQNLVFDDNEIMSRNNGATATLSLNNNGGAVAIGAGGGGSLGINTASPATPLHVVGGGDATPTGGGFAVIGTVSGQNLVFDDNEIISRNNGAAAILSLNNNGGAVSIGASGGGSLGIGRNPLANALEVAGTASKSTAGSWSANSDARIKTGVQTVTGALDKLTQVRLVQFHYTEAYRAAHPSIEDQAYLNVIAQEFQKVFPDHVKSSGDKLPGGAAILQVDTYPLTIYSAAAIQELNQKVEAKEAAIEELKKAVAELKELTSQLARQQKESGR